MLLDTLLSRHARYRLQHIALVFEDQGITFEQLDRRVTEIATALTGLGLEQGDKNATVLDNCVEVIADADRIREWVNQRVDARYQKLSHVVVLDTFPRNAAGKTLRREIRETYARTEGES